MRQVAAHLWLLLWCSQEPWACVEVDDDMVSSQQAPMRYNIKPTVYRQIVASRMNEVKHRPPQNLSQKEFMRAYMISTETEAQLRCKTKSFEWRYQMKSKVPPKFCYTIHIMILILHILVTWRHAQNLVETYHLIQWPITLQPQKENALKKNWVRDWIRARPHYTCV